MIRTILRRVIIFPVLAIGSPLLYVIGILMTDREETNEILNIMFKEAWNGIK